jgi:hypothetical protein
MPTNVPAKTKILDQKLTEISSKGQKPTIGAVPQGFQPSHKTLASQVNKYLNKLIFYLKII